jgi:hypothetical protein
MLTELTEKACQVLFVIFSTLIVCMGLLRTEVSAFLERGIFHRRT